MTSDHFMRRLSISACRHSLNDQLFRRHERELCVHALPAQLPPGFLVLIWGYFFILRQNRSTLPLPVTVGIYLLWVLASGGDWMQEGRFVTPILPAVSIAIAAAYVKFCSGPTPR